MSLHKEVKLEDEICDHLSANGWLYAEKDASDYDRQLALFPADVLACIQQQQHLGGHPGNVRFVRHLEHRSLRRFSSDALG